MSSIMSMSSMVSSSLLMKVELLEPVSMALSSEVCELEEEKNRTSHGQVQTNQTMVVFLGCPPQKQRRSSCKILDMPTQVTHLGKILPPRQTATHHPSHCRGPHGKARAIGHLHTSAFLLCCPTFTKVANELQPFLLSLLQLARKIERGSQSWYSLGLAVRSWHCSPANPLLTLRMLGSGRGEDRATEHASPQFIC